MIEEFLNALPERPTIVEAGAHHGEDTIELARGGAHVHAFEPIRAVYEQLVENTRGLRDVTCWQYAPGRRDDTRSMWVASGDHDASSSLYEPSGHLEAFPGVEFREREMVPVTSLARVVGDFDGLWLDVQGAELDVLKGAGRALDGASALMVEVSDIPLYEGAPLASEVLRWIDKQRPKWWVRRLEREGAHQSNVLLTRAA